MANIQEKFEIWCKKLYDISKRNYMMNFTGQHNRSLLLNQPDMFQLYRLLVLEDKSLSFKRNITRENNFNVFAIETLIQALGSDFSFKEGDIDTTTFKDKNSYDVLRNIKRVANEFKMEQGIDVMYITFAYLRWQPPFSNEYYKTPLINVPVVLEQENMNALYSVSRIGDPEINPILKYMLEQQGIFLPEMNELSLEEYLTNLEKLVNENGWEILQEATLCILFFQKMVMFKDLQTNQQRIFNHPILKAFCDETLFDMSEDDLDFDHDHENEKDRLIVVQADSSQMDAISLAKKGKSFVLQGPPGTGKSQTITNIIAQAIGNGQKVLFVSQKTAALEVVYNKLKNVGLDEFCLPLHNHKINKTKIVNQIYHPYLLKKTMVKQEKLNELDRLQTLKVEINQYAQNIAQKVYHLDMSFLDMINSYYEVCDVEDGDFDILNWATITQNQLNETLTTIKMFEEQYQNYQQENHPCFDDCLIVSLTLLEKENLEKELLKTKENIQSVITLLDSINFYIADFQIAFKDSWQAIKDLQMVIEKNRNNFNFLQNHDGKKIVLLLEQIQNKKNLLQENERYLKKIFKEEILTLDLKEIALPIQENLQLVNQSVLFFKNQSHEYIFTHLMDYQDALERHIRYQKEISDAKSTLKRMLNLTTDEFENLNYYELWEELNNNSYDLTFIDIVYKDYETIKKQLMQVNHTQQEIKDIQDLIRSYAILSILNIDKDALLNYQFIINNTENSFTLLFNSAKRELRKDVFNTLSVYLKENVKVNQENIEKVLNLLVKYHQLKEQIDNELTSLNDQILEGKEFTIDMDFANLLKEFEKIHHIFNLLPNIQLETLKNILSFASKEIIKEQIHIYIEAKAQLFNNDKKYSIFVSNQNLEENVEYLHRLTQSLQKLSCYLTNSFEMNHLDEYLKRMMVYQETKEEYEKNGKLLSSICPDSTLYHQFMEQNENIRFFFAFCEKYSIQERSFFQLNESHFHEITESIQHFLKRYPNAMESYTYFLSLFNENKHIELYNNDELLQLIDDCSQNVSALKNKIFFQKSMRDYENNEELSDFIQYCLHHTINEKLTSVYLKKFYLKTLQNFIYDNDYLENTSKAKLLSKIDEFTLLCKEQLEINKAKIRSTCLENIPPLKTNLASSDERNYLLREYKRSRKRPIRQLFDHIPHLLLNLKPCLMMSPLTVSNYLENDNYQFDLVVFDEASQIRPEEAIGSIYRAKQIIIAGDSRQLPPTSFFSKRMEEDIEMDEEEYELEDLDESILEYAARKLPSITLLWHYRSKNESLIAFSNHYIYENNLITLPSVKQSSKDFGMEYIYVQGIYSKKKKLANSIEAEKVVELIEEHILKYGTSRSLGVIAFGERQKYTIDKAILEFRKNHLQNEQYEAFFSGDLKEPFFVKNIENVQGDERDTIIFSIGYGKDENGVFRYHFGPLQQAGGERRLNVAISRAKYNLKVVASFYPEEIDLSRIESEGVKLLKKYLEFACQASSLDFLPCQKEENEGLKDKIASFLKKHDYDVVFNYGYSSFKIDLAVFEKQNHQQFICGILLDGKRYVQEKTCRDREFIKNEMLKENDWRIYRIFSKFYLENEEMENQALLQFIQSKALNEEAHTFSESYVIELEETNEKKNDYGFEIYHLFDFNQYKKEPLSFLGFSLAMINEKLIEAVLQDMGVMHIHDLSLQIANAYKINEYRVQNRILKIIESEKFEKDRFFIYLKGSNLHKVRQVQGQDKRLLEYIYPQEIHECLRIILKNNMGLDRDGLIREAMMVFGQKIKSSKVTDFFNKYINRLLNEKEIIEIDGMLSIAGTGGENDESRRK